MSADAPSPVPSSREFTLLGITYGLFAIGLVLMWPAFVGLVMAYIKQGDVQGTFLASHYRWLVRTFWWWTGLFVLSLAGIIATVLPAAIDMGRAMRASDMMTLPWSMLGGAVAGGIVIALVWFWVVYRLIRGTLRLADGRPVP
jgi:uncharacterized membrane protein